MSSKDYYRNKIADKRKEIVSLRTKMAKVKEDKKRKMASLANSLKSTKDASRKESIRREKISVVSHCERDIDSLKNKIESLKGDIDNLRTSMARVK